MEAVLRVQEVVNEKQELEQKKEEARRGGHK